MTPRASARGGPIVCGHRGAAAVAPENTLASFAAASARGATWVEFDVRPAAGGTFVVHHDPVTAAGLRVASTAPGELDPSIPTFGDVVAACPGIGLDIELKTDDVGMDAAEYVARIGREIRTHCAAHGAPIIVTSFDAPALDMYRRTNPDVATGLLFHDRSTAWALTTATRAGHGAIAPWFPLVDADLVENAHRRGIDVLTWTVNDPGDVATVAEAGVDMIIGDDPAVIIETLAGR